MRRHGNRKAYARRQHIGRLALGKASNFRRVIVLFDAGLDWLPIAQRHLRTVTEQERSGDHCLSDARVGPGYEQTAEHRADSLTAAPSAAAKPRIVASLRPMFTEIRRRDVPGATVGGRMARTSKPCDCSD